MNSYYLVVSKHQINNIITRACSSSLLPTHIILYLVQVGPSSKVVELSSLWASLNSSGQYPHTVTLSLLLESVVNKQPFSSPKLGISVIRTTFWFQHVWMNDFPLCVYLPCIQSPQFNLCGCLFQQLFQHGNGLVLALCKLKQNEVLVKC